MPVFKAIVKRVRDWKKNAVGSEYTRYFNSAEDMAKATAGYAKYYGPDIARTMGWGTLAGVNAAITGLTATGGLLYAKKITDRLSAVSGSLLGASATVMTAEMAAESILKIRKKAQDLKRFKESTGIKSMSEVFKKEREGVSATVDKAGKELVYNHFEK